MSAIDKKLFYAMRDRAFKDACKTLRLLNGFKGRVIASYLASEIDNARDIQELEKAKMEFRNYLHETTGKLARFDEVK